MTVAKMRIEIRKPQHLAGKDPADEAMVVKPKPPKQKTPFFSRLLIFATCVLSALALWFVYLKYTGRG